jgi:hypothetical protein
MRYALLALGLVACGPPEVHSWHPAHSAAKTSEITSRAIEVGEPDLPKIQEAGGVLNGTITITSDSGTDPARGAAYYGGTHFMADGESHAVARSTTVHTVTRYRVYRVPVSKWDRLPRSLRPSPP